ncbi:hypothetical protein FNJ62_31255 [Streptomyces benahoarensis]|uniref:Uncharacterized protein n=1 Tax=Streptomyces benahoarensis TaxID=2595054 RepID=A0A553XD87_9ACTN|nr:hypothetical protein FNJ62_31255 [Streptomyces benahoarensis]TSB14949.1 hypothetical protein FNZ23_31045 [Streptomyces benahoarensis]
MGRAADGRRAPVLAPYRRARGGRRGRRHRAGLRRRLAAVGPGRRARTEARPAHPDGQRPGVVPGAAHGTHGADADRHRPPRGLPPRPQHRQGLHPRRTGGLAARLPHGR